MSTDSGLRVLLDEHYPAWLADRLTEDGIDVDSVQRRDDLRGRPGPHRGHHH